MQAVQRFIVFATAHRIGQTDKRGFKTKRDAEAFANSVEVTKARGQYAAPSLGRVNRRGAGASVAKASAMAYEGQRVSLV
jgi:Arm DNA-binding domain